MERSVPTNFNYNGISLVLTCMAYPEQYGAFDKNGKQVGYLRLRYGEFRVDFPYAHARTIYEASPNGDGNFDDDEREKNLIAAIEAIKAASNS